MLSSPFRAQKLAQGLPVDIGANFFCNRTSQVQETVHYDQKYLWDALRPIIPYSTGRFSRGTSCQATIGVAPPGQRVAVSEC